MDSVVELYNSDISRKIYMDVDIFCGTAAVSAIQPWQMLALLPSAP